MLRSHARLLASRTARSSSRTSPASPGSGSTATKIASPTPLREGDEILIGDYSWSCAGIGLRLDSTGRRTRSLPGGHHRAAGHGGGTGGDPHRASVAAMAAQQPAFPRRRPTAAVAPAAFADARPPPQADDRQSPSPTGPWPRWWRGSPTTRCAPSARGRPGTSSPSRPAAPPGGADDRLAGLGRFALDKASLVIGRTEENDVLLNHRSISAPPRQDRARRRPLHDRRSAERQRHPGQRRGLRADRAERRATSSSSVTSRFGSWGRSKTSSSTRTRHSRGNVPVKAIALGGGALALIGLAALFLHRPSSSEPPVAAASTPPGGSRPSAGRSARLRRWPCGHHRPRRRLRTILARGQESDGGGGLGQRAGTLARITPADEPAIRREATALGRRVETERQGASMFAKFDEAANAKNYAAAVSGFHQIPADSVYKRRAQPRYEEARTLLVAEHMTAAEKIVPTAAVPTCASRRPRLSGSSRTIS